MVGHLKDGGILLKLKAELPINACEIQGDTRGESPCGEGSGVGRRLSFQYVPFCTSNLFLYCIYVLALKSMNSVPFRLNT